jgi:hypothetical protein
MSDPPMLEHENAYVSAWQNSALNGPDPGRLAAEMATSVARFDRKIFWRNAIEYVAGAVVLTWSIYEARQGSPRAFVVIAGVVFVLGYLWWKHRTVRTLNPLADARSYQAALMKRLDDQVRLLSRVRYWCLLPLYPPMVWTAVVGWSRNPWGAVAELALVTALFVIVALVNEVYGVRKLKADRAHVEALLQD